MPNDQASPPPTMADKGWRGPIPTKEQLASIDCYCGLGPKCVYFRQMTWEERTACSQDKRQTAEAYFKAGMNR